MKKIRLALRELKSLLVTINLLEGFLDALVLFLLCFAVLMITTLHPLWAALPFFLYLAWHIKKKLTTIKLAQVEEKTPELEWQLRTVADNVNKENEIINELNQEVLVSMKKILLSEFIDFKRLGRQLAVAAFLAFLIIFLAGANVRFIDIGKIANELKLPEFSKSKATFEPYEGYGEGAGDGDIWGEESLAELGQKELELQINPMLSEIDINDIRDVEDKDFQHGEIPEIIATSDTSFDEDIPKEHREVVKRYFMQITN